MVFYETTATALKEVIIFRPRTITVFQLSVYYRHFPSLYYRSSLPSTGRHIDSWPWLVGRSLAVGLHAAVLGASHCAILGTETVGAYITPQKEQLEPGAVTSHSRERSERRLIFPA